MSGGDGLDSGRSRWCLGAPDAALTVASSPWDSRRQSVGSRRTGETDGVPGRFNGSLNSGVRNMEELNLTTEERRLIVDKRMACARRAVKSAMEAFVVAPFANKNDLLRAIDSLCRQAEEQAQRAGV